MTQGARWRPAQEVDAVALMELERDANLAALGHVFPGPFPEDDVLARWSIVLADPEVRVDVVDGPGHLRAVTAYDETSLRHLFVHPDAWGEGLGRQGVDRATTAGGMGIRLWVLQDNERARRLYEFLGWVPTGECQECVWPPHPSELEHRWTGTMIRELSLEHRDALFAFEVENREWFARTIPDRGDAFFEEFDDVLADRIAEQTSGGVRMFVILDEMSSVIGRLNFVDIDGDSAHLGYRLAETVSGQGRATDAVTLGLTEMARRGVTVVRAATTVSNVASMRVLEKCGFERCQGEPAELGGAGGRREEAVHFVVRSGAPRR